MSVIADALRKSNEVHFLIELNFNGLVDRISESNIAVPSGYFFEGKVLNNIIIGTTFDLDNFRYSVSTVNIRRANDDRFMDNERFRVMDGSIGKIWVWCEGLTWAQIETDGLIFIGTFEKVGHNKREYVFNLNDLTKRKTGNLTGNSINVDTWPLHRQTGGGGSVSGKAAPVVFGAWAKGIPLIPVDTTAYKYIATYGVADSADADYTATTVNVYTSAGAVIATSAYEFVKGVDALGNPCCYFDFTGDQTSNEPLSCSINGITDGSGEYTGTEGEVLHHQADIASYTLERLAGLSSDYIDRQSIKALKQSIPNIRHAAYIGSETQTSAFLQRIFFQTMSAMVPKNGKIGAMNIDMDAQPSGRLIQNHHQIGDTAEFGITPERLLCNKLELQYDYNPTTGAYEKVLRINRTNNETCKLSYYQYGFEYARTLQLPDIYREQDAQWIGARFISIFAFRHYLIEMEVAYPDGWDFREGSCAMIQLEELPDPENDVLMSRCILIEKTFTHRTIKQKWFKINSQTAYDAPGQGEALKAYKTPIFEDAQVDLEGSEDAEFLER